MPMSEPFLTIWCDKCGFKDDFELTEMAPAHLWSDAGAKESFEAEGWVFLDDGDTVCGGCAGKRRNEMKNHILHECHDEDCYICGSGLSYCEVCKGAECSLTTECCGRPLTETEEWLICYLGILDYVDGRWVLNAKEG